MKTVILCGGMGTRLAEETRLRPKPLVTVGGHPILWHILNSYGFYGFNRFTLALGYMARRSRSISSITTPSTAICASI